MCEWLKQAVLKTAVRETVPGVRIPLPPPHTQLIKEAFTQRHGTLSLVSSGSFKAQVEHYNQAVLLGNPYGEKFDHAIARTIPRFRLFQQLPIASVANDLRDRNCGC
jgi:hypothetical protein